MTPARDEKLRIGSVMTRSPVSVPIGAGLREAEDLMIDHEVRHLPVVEDDELVGVVSDRDLAFAENHPDPSWMDRLTVREVCSLDLYTVAPDAPLEAVLAEMAERRLGCVVVTKGARIAGIFTATDACRCFAAHLHRTG